LKTWTNVGKPSRKKLEAWKFTEYRIYITRYIFNTSFDGYICTNLWSHKIFQSSLQIFYGHHHNLVDLYEVSISQMTMDLLIFTYGFFPLSMPRVLPDLIVYTNVWVTRRVSYKKQELLTFREHMSSPPFFGSVRVAHLFSFLCCSIICI
jgi:hypothetical protein